MKRILQILRSLFGLFVCRFCPPKMEDGRPKTDDQTPKCCILGILGRPTPFAIARPSDINLRQLKTKLIKIYVRQFCTLGRGEEDKKWQPGPGDPKQALRRKYDRAHPVTLIAGCVLGNGEAVSALNGPLKKLPVRKRTSVLSESEDEVVKNGRMVVIVGHRYWSAWSLA